MKTYNFFEGCLKATKNKFDELVKTPRARGRQYEIEKLDIINQINTSVGYGEISQKEVDYLIKEFHKVRFTELSYARKELKRKRIKNEQTRIYTKNN